MAASYRRYDLPASLMQRLALMQHYALQAKALAEGRAPAEMPAWPTRPAPRLGRQAVVLAWFSLGVLLSGALGVGAVVGLRSLAAADALPAWAAWTRPRAIAAASKPPAPTALLGSPEAKWETVQVLVDHSAVAQAPLNLKLVAPDDMSIEVLLRDVPAGVRPSRGEAIGSSTWALKPNDLDGLYLVIDEMAPQSFDLRVGVLAPAGVMTAGSIVQVRRSDPPAPVQAAIPGKPPAQYGEAAAVARATTEVAKAVPRASPATVSAAVGPAADKVASPAVQRPAAPPATADPPRAGTPTAAAKTWWPEGASGLGAVSRAPERQSWWAPPPSWSPFQVGQERP